MHQRLFVAITPPEGIIDKLFEIMPRPNAGIRLTSRNNIHLTLHFIGDADPDNVAEMLSDVSGQSFSLVVEGVGEFRTRSGRILWAGVRSEPALLQLQKTIGDVLRAGGYKMENRAYHPHITLARTDPDAERSSISRFLETNICLQPFPVPEFTLYSSSSGSGKLIYTPIGRFPLT